jgi:hypothetical protein
MHVQDHTSPKHLFFLEKKYEIHTTNANHAYSTRITSLVNMGNQTVLHQPNGRLKNNISIIS